VQSRTSDVWPSLHPVKVGNNVAGNITILIERNDVDPDPDLNPWPIRVVSDDLWINRLEGCKARTVSATPSSIGQSSQPFLMKVFVRTEVGEMQGSLVLIS
jgi:hypothetical protein